MPSVENAMPISSWLGDKNFLHLCAEQVPECLAPLSFKEKVDPFPHQELEFSKEINVIGLFRHYLLVEAFSLPRPFSFASSGIVWIDLCAVNSRLQFEAMMRSCESLASLSQGLLMPLTLRFSNAEAELLRANLGIIQKFGMQIRDIGQTVFLIEAISPFLEEGEVKIALDEIIGELQGMEHERSVHEDKDRRLALCICRRVQARKKSYSLSEATHMINELLHAEDPFHCPQGKKTIFYVKEEEIESYFTRKAASSSAIETFAERFERGKT